MAVPAATQSVGSILSDRMKLLEYLLRAGAWLFRVMASIFGSDAKLNACSAYLFHADLVLNAAVRLNLQVAVDSPSFDLG
jgi:hypothetical protein